MVAQKKKFLAKIEHSQSFALYFREDANESSYHHVRVNSSCLHLFVKIISLASSVEQLGRRGGCSGGLFF